MSDQDTYNVQNAGSVGKNASVGYVSFNILNNNNTNESKNQHLTNELLALIDAIGRSNETPENIASSTALLQQAAKESTQGDQARVNDTLKGIGKWVFEFAEKVGTTVAAAAIKASLGI